MKFGAKFLLVFYKKCLIFSLKISKFSWFLSFFLNVPFSYTDLYFEEQYKYIWILQGEPEFRPCFEPSVKRGWKLFFSFIVSVVLWEICLAKSFSLGCRTVVLYGANINIYLTPLELRNESCLDLFYDPSLNSIGGCLIGGRGYLFLDNILKGRLFSTDRFVTCQVCQKWSCRKLHCYT